jgi:endonuclease-3
MTKENLAFKKHRALSVFDILNHTYPGTRTFLTHKNPFELLIATILSAQCTDERVNKVTPALFEAFPTYNHFAEASVEAIQVFIQSVNFCNAKAKNIHATAVMIRDRYNGVVPSILEELIKLPGVGRKTANVVLGQAFDTPGITVDTHVNRLSRRLGFSTHTDAHKIEQDLMKLWPKETWTNFSSVLILHGRQCCTARKPMCEGCVIAHLCPKLILRR